MRVAVFGGSFNPPHVAHVLAVSYVLSVGVCDRLLVIPVFQHAFDKNRQLVDFEHRLRMCELAMGWLKNVTISDIESELEPPSYTLHTLQRLKRKHPDWQLRLVVGADVLAETDKWHAFDEVAALAPPFALGRIGFEQQGVPQLLPEVSSSAIRVWLSERPEGDELRLQRWVPQSVRQYIERHDLYR